MNFEHYKIEFAHEATKVGYTEQNIQRCLIYAEVLSSNDLPIIYNTSHLSSLVGYKKTYLKRAVIYTPKFYRNFYISKTNGSKRLISEPLPSLKEIQIWILENILYNIKISPFAKAYVPKVGIKENIKFHKSQPKVLTLDLENFFPSIKQPDIEIIFLNLGYSVNLSNLLSKLCSLNNCLPQGAPTSPYLSNIFFKPADDIISNYCLERKIKYTRYADDLTFSGSFDEKELLKMVLTVIDGLKMRVNTSKTRLMTPNTRQIVTGIVVNEKLQVVFKKRNKLRQELYYIQKFGLNSHIQRMKITQANYLEYLLGKINFILQINPEDTEFQGYKTYLLNLKQNN